LAGKSEGNKENFGDPGIDGRKILKLIFKKMGYFCVGCNEMAQDWVKHFWTQ